MINAKVLVVDDESDLELLIKQKFRRQIREGSYEFLFAANGREAIELLGRQPDVQMVLSDINMPIMDGLTLLSKIGEMSPLIKVVMVSAYGDMDNIRVAMNRGAFDFVCKPVNFDDLELTVNKTLLHVQQLRDTLQAIKENNILRMYVDEHVLSFMAHQEFEASLMSNETVEASVVFMDICGFTAITEKADADTVVRLINEYFDIMVKEIIAQKGHIDKFMGDAVMAVFRGEYHLDRAIEASLAVRSHIQALETNALANTTYAPRVAIGINSGEMISGNIGSVSLRRLDYTVIGDCVNVAQRFQSVAKPGQIVIGQNSYDHVKQSFHCEPVGEVVLKNKALPLMIYEVLE